MYRVNGGGSSLEEHFRALAGSGGHADRLALIQARPVAGDPALGERFVAAARAFIVGTRVARGDIGALWRDGRGAELSGARQVERVTQLFQLAHGAEHPGVIPVGHAGRA